MDHALFLLFWSGRFPPDIFSGAVALLFPLFVLHRERSGGLLRFFYLLRLLLSGTFRIHPDRAIPAVRIVPNDILQIFQDRFGPVRLAVVPRHNGRVKRIIFVVCIFVI